MRSIFDTCISSFKNALTLTASDYWVLTKMAPATLPSQVARLASNLYERYNALLTA